MNDKKSLIEELATLPATNFTIFVGQGLAVIFVVFVLIGIAAGWITPDNDSVLYVPAGFIAAMLGLGVTQFGVKRATFDPATLGMKREDIDPPPAAPATAVVNAAVAVRSPIIPESPVTPETVGAATRALPDLSKPYVGDSEPRNPQDERGS